MIVRKFPTRYFGPFTNLNADLIREEVDAMFKVILKLVKVLISNPQAKRIAEQLRLKIEKFKIYLPILDAICRQGLTDRHWQQISDELGQPVSPQMQSSLCAMIDVDIQRIVGRLEEISNAAGNEYELNMQLSVMQSEWKDVAFELLPYR